MKCGILFWGRRDTPLCKRCAVGVSTDRRLPVTEYRGQCPCIPPHLLGRILDKLQPLRAKLCGEVERKSDPRAGIDALSKSMEAAK
jgi:hypothetical protein